MINIDNRKILGVLPIYLGNYTEGTVYQMLQQVTHLGSTFQSKINNNAYTPCKITDFGLDVHPSWQVIAKGSADGIDNNRLDNLEKVTGDLNNEFTNLDTDFKGISTDVTELNETVLNKTYAPANHSGLGRVNLKKNIYINGKNILTQDMISTANTIYTIQYDYDLNGATITVPEGCTLKFDGGSLANGVLNCNMSFVTGIISGNLYNYIIQSVNYVDINWFYTQSDSGNYRNALMRACDAAKLLDRYVYIPTGIYTITGADILYDDITIKGDGNTSVLYNNTWGNWCIRCNKDRLTISDISIDAIPHTDVVRSLGEEGDDGCAGILYKGNYGIFNNIHGNEIQQIIALGGNKLDINSFRYGNRCFNITCHNVQWGVVALQQSNIYIDNISGDFATFSAVDYVSGGNPGHLVYISGITGRESKDVHISNLVCNYGFAGTVISVKYIINLNIYNIQCTNSSAIYADTCSNATINNIICNNNTSYKYAMQLANVGGAVLDQADYYNNVNYYVTNVVCNNGNAYIRFSDKSIVVCDGININPDKTNVIGVSASLDFTGAQFVDIKGYKCKSYRDSYFPSIRASDVNCIIDTDELINDVNYISGASNAIIKTLDTPYDKSNFKNVIIKSNSYNTLIATESTDRYVAKIFNQNQQSYFHINSVKQLILTFLYAKKQSCSILIYNNTNSDIPIRCTDVDVTMNISSNIKYDNAILKSKSYCQYYIHVSDNNCIIHRVDNYIINKGTTAQRPTLLSTDVGFQFYDTTSKKYICWSGTAWTNLDGTTLT